MIYETQNRRSEIPKLKSQSYDLHEWAINSKKGWFTSSWPISYKESSNSTMATPRGIVERFNVW
jgi:hypothetical protein